MTDNNSTNQNSKTYKQVAGEYYNKQYETWMPWIEDKYLSWFTKDNKASYATKRMLTSNPPSQTYSTTTPSAHRIHNYTDIQN